MRVILSPTSEMHVVGGELYSHKETFTHRCYYFCHSNITYYIENKLVIQLHNVRLCIEKNKKFNITRLVLTNNEQTHTYAHMCLSTEKIIE
jgi:uncharacterized protein YbcV (DUF1398 family)